MGVRKLFPSLTQKYKNNIVFVRSNTEDLNQQNIHQIDELYIDGNCLLHPVCMKTYSENKSLLRTNIKQLEMLMIVNIVTYIDDMVNIVNPSTLVYISIDGVAPFAKNKQQHSRRYKSIHEQRMIKRISKKYDQPYEQPWNNSAITPGTEFMEKITNGVINYLRTKKKIVKEKKNVKYIFSSAYTPDEGEHKILQYIKSSTKTCSRVIYGLDADLIYLSMASEKENMFLMREITAFQHLQSEDGYCYVSIDNLKIGIFKDIKERLNDDNVDGRSFENLDLYKNRFLMDYIFFGFMIGNDFLSNIPSVNLNYDKEYSGLNVMLVAYNYAFQNINERKTSDYEFLVSNTNGFSINYLFFKEFLGFIASNEESYFRNTFRFRKKTVVKPETFEDELKVQENLQFYIPDIFKLGFKHVPHEESKRRFYEYYKMTDIDAVCEAYIEGLVWNGHYYFRECADYLWHYPYSKSPFATDLILWLLNNREKFEQIMTKYPLQKSNKYSISPLEQLLLVLPVQSSFLLPRQAKSIMLKHPETFPVKFNIDLQDISKLWQAKPMIPVPSIPLIKTLILSMSLTDKEQKRNQFKSAYEITI